MKELLPEKKMYSKTQHEAARFCSFCGLFSRSEANKNRKSIYVCKCQDKPAASKLKFCDRCSLYLNTSIEAYRCKCSEVFCVPKIEVDLDHSSEPKLNKTKTKNKNKTKPSNVKKKAKKKTKVK